MDNAAAESFPFDDGGKVLDTALKYSYTAEEHI